MLKNLTSILAISRTYILASISSEKLNNIAISINLKDINSSGRDWLLEIPLRYSYILPIDENWISYIDGDVLTYYKGNLLKAHKYYIHLYKPENHLYKRNNKLEDIPKDTESLFLITHDNDNNVLLNKTLYFWDINNPKIYTINYIKNNFENMTKIF